MKRYPRLNSLQNELQAQGLRIVGASLDDSIEGVNAYQQEVAKFEYQVLLGGSDAKVKFAQSVLPTTYLIDRQGRIRQKLSEPRTKPGGKLCQAVAGGSPGNGERKLTSSIRTE